MEQDFMNYDIYIMVYHTAIQKVSTRQVEFNDFFVYVLLSMKKKVWKAYKV